MKNQYSEEDIIIRIPRRLYNKRVQNILSHIGHIKIASKSKATEKDIDNMLADMKKARGKMMRSLLKERGLLGKI